MKTKLFIILTSIFLLFSIMASTQVDPKKKAKKETTKRIKKIEKGLGGLFNKKKNKSKEKEGDKKQTELQEKSTLVWSKYDFIPGDRVIFEDNLVNEENGEFPSRWDLHRGNVEVAEFDGEYVIMFRDGAPTIIPYLKYSHEDYLPEIFTIEFDLYTGINNFTVFFYDRKNQKSAGTSLNIRYNQIQYGPSTSKLPEEKSVAKRRWIHVAIAFTKGKLKAYIDETRLINIPRVDFNPKGISLHSYHSRNNNHYYVKNIRIAKGGIKYYNRVMQDGKIIANGIRFNVNKATLLPESMGIINKIYNLMKDNPEIYFSVEGHTDSDGSGASNQLLSEKRAETVVNTLTKKGIPVNRFISKGWGESKPIDTNATPEGKANNRRVEFVKITKE